ncbi:MAG: exodeoxyribonuclease VII large subunit [Bacteroidales bacterium]
MKIAIDEPITLSVLQNRIGEAIKKNVTGEYWVKGEIGEINVNATGHCYITLIEREGELQVKAKAQAIIWASRYRVLSHLFSAATGSSLSKGMKILVKAFVEYNILYGLSLQISDIDPTHTVGEQELLRQQTIAKLKEEGMFEINSSLPFPSLPRRIAIISAESAAGYNDFITHLHNNEYGFQFSTHLFSAPMQGESAPAGIGEALERVASQIEEFDLLFLIRGGGGAHDLSCFDNYELALNIAQFPLPIITGIGHQHDYHIADMVAHTNLKTPTAAADFLISLFAAEERQIVSFSQRLNLALQGRFSTETSRLERFKERINRGVLVRASAEEYKIESLQLKLKSANPLESLQRGFALPYRQGKRLFSSVGLEPGEEIIFKFVDSTLFCRVERVIQ